MKKSVSGFTTVELMIVIAIIGLLAGIIIPNLKRVQDRAGGLNSAEKTNFLYIVSSTGNVVHYEPIIGLPSRRQDQNFLAWDGLDGVRHWHYLFGGLAVHISSTNREASVFPNAQ